MTVAHACAKAWRWCQVAACAAQGLWLVPAGAAIVMPMESAPPEPVATEPATAPARSILMPEAPAAEGAAPAQLTQQAQAGDVNAMLALGHYFYSHPGVPQAAAQARRWWTQAAQAGDARAMAALGYFLTTQGGAGNLPLARQWLERASALGLTRALYLRARLARTTPGPREARQAMAWLEQAAREGDVMALNDLGVERELAGDLMGAAELYRRAALAGLDVARQNQARLERREQPAAAALERLRTLADEGDPDALLALAKRYHRGDGVPRDYARAIQYYRRAADAGSLQAKEILSLIFSSGNAADGVGMQELGARLSASSDWGEARRAPALSRPTQVSDPLADLLKPFNPASVAR